MSDTSQKASSERGTNVQEFIENLDAGMLEKQLGIALSDVSAAAVDHGGVGEVTIKFTIKPITGTHQVHCAHSLKFVKPTSSGKATEELARATVLHVGKYGRLSLAPETQLDMFKQPANN